MPGSREGPVIAIGVQQHAMTDSAWRKPHRDYRNEAILDIWLRHQRVGVPGVALGEPQCHWQLNEQLDRIGMPIAHAHIVTRGMQRRLVYGLMSITRRAREIG
jgi:hypothetical protein